MIGDKRKVLSEKSRGVFQFWTRPDAMMQGESDRFAVLASICFSRSGFELVGKPLKFFRLVPTEG